MVKFNLRKLVTLGAVFMLGIGGLAGCGNTGLDNGSSSQSKVEKKSPKDITIGVSISTLSNPAFINLRNQVESYAKKNGSKVQVVDAQNDTSKQNNQIEDLIQQKVDALIINPCDSSAITSAVRSANRAGIPVFCVDRSSDGGNVTSTIASDSVKGGEMAAKYLVDTVGKDAKVAEITGIPGASATRERGKGFDTYAKGKLDIVTKQTANFDRAKAQQVTENILQAHPEITAIFAQNDEEAVGAALAVKASGKDIKIIGFDGAKAALNDIKNGTISATIGQQWKQMGTESVKNVYKYYQGKKVRKDIKANVQLITKDTLGDYKG
ncbi:substrate-binding domain-containing protein [Ligilactobacillus agilis]|uniref:substrate-binding domain-containing protein n=1 Tax=Ligilactobacillus agilis TaxID=1601 RepID=UPI003F8B4384